jgi:glycopeptide antibiotics resistance protein
MRTLRWSLLLYLLLLGIVVSFPLGPPRAPWKRHLLTDLKPAHLTAFAQDVVVNVALFTPVGLMGRLLLGAGAAAAVFTVVGSALLSVGIETVQHVYLPWRYSSWIDVVANTAGAGLGTGLAGLVLRFDGRAPRDVDLGVGHR